jgi:hypothetical protein
VVLVVCRGRFGGCESEVTRARYSDGITNHQGIDRACWEARTVGETAWLCSEANRMHEKAFDESGQHEPSISLLIKHGKLGIDKLWLNVIPKGLKRP